MNVTIKNSLYIDVELPDKCTTDYINKMQLTDTCLTVNKIAYNQQVNVK